MCEKVKMLLHLKLSPLFEIFPNCPEVECELISLKFSTVLTLNAQQLLSLEPVLNSVNYKVGYGSIKLDDTLNESNVSNILQLDKSLKSSTKKLEEAFFRSHPRSLQRTVEFVIDRVVSNCVKDLRAGFLPEKLREINRQLKVFFTEKIEIISTQYINDHIDETVEITKVSAVRTCIEKSRKFIDSNVDENLKFLFSKDLHPHVIETAGKIIKRDAKEKTEQWFKEHVPMIVLRDGKPAFERSRKRVAMQNDKIKPRVEFIPDLTYTNLDTLKDTVSKYQRLQKLPNFETFLSDIEVMTSNVENKLYEDSTEKAIILLFTTSMFIVLKHLENCETFDTFAARICPILTENLKLTKCEFSMPALVEMFIETDQDKRRLNFILTCLKNDS